MNLKLEEFPVVEYKIRTLNQQLHSSHPEGKAVIIMWNDCQEKVM